MPAPSKEEAGGEALHLRFKLKHRLPNFCSLGSYPTEQTLGFMIDNPRTQRRNLVHDELHSHDAAPGLISCHRQRGSALDGAKLQWQVIWCE